MFSASEESFGSAVRELRDAFGRDLVVERVGPDVGVLGAVSPTIDEVADACRATRIAFVRHLTVEHARLPHPADVGAISAAAGELVAEAGIHGDLAVQVWASGAPKVGYSSGSVFTALKDDLAAAGVEVARSGREHVLSVCITPQGVLLGLNRSAESLSDWPGGRVRLAKHDGHVSRAEFKLEELFQLMPLDLPVSGKALDLGAAPGGWTRILRLRGLEVWAVDPGDLDGRIVADPAVHHVRTTAGEFFRSNETSFDIVVNDMRMDPLLSCRFMLDAGSQLRPGALAVTTLKTGVHRSLDTLHRCLALLEEQYDTVFARQLHHNRHELTVVSRRRA
jgi:23S rRNA (cytidine2498-2'-O)-methyltransferase